MLTRLLLATLLACSLSSCTMYFKPNGGRKIASFDKRSIVYAWIDMQEASSNIDTAVIERLQPVTPERLYTLGVARYKTGYVLYHIGLPEGAYKLTYFKGHGCLVGFLLCDDGTVYDLPKQGSEGGVIVKKPGVYFLGALRYRNVKTGFWQAGKFSLEKDSKAPSQQELLQVIHDRLAKDYPERVQRLAPALAAKR